MWRYRSRGDAVLQQGLDRSSRNEWQDADLFFADLLGTPRQPGPVAMAPWRPPTAARSPRASWSRPDLIFDQYARRAPEDAEVPLGELADEGWEVVASPGSDTPQDDLKVGDIVVRRALAEGKLASIEALEDVDLASLYGPRHRIREDTLVLRQPATTYGPVEDVTPTPAPATAPDAGETIVHLPLLLSHAARGFPYDLSGPNCVLRWARVPRAFSGGIDVVVHFHGYKEHKKLQLQAKANASGLDLDSPGVTRPTLGIVPQGRAFKSQIPNTDGFAFPAIASRDALKQLIDAGLAALKQQIGSADRTLTPERVILTGHSGGGAALNLLMRSIGSNDNADAFQYFDATYGGTSVIADERGWLVAALRRDAQALHGVSGETERARVMRERGGGLRILFIDGSPTASTARAVDRFIAAKLRELVPDESVRTFLRRYYRAQRVANPRPGEHDRIPKKFGGRLLADRGHNLDPDARDLPVSRVPAEDVPTTTPVQGDALDRVRTTIDATLRSFRNIVVSVPAPTGRDVGVEVPYFINKPTSPSRLRAEGRRPALLRNAALSKLYQALPNRARVGKSHPTDVRTLLQGALDANAVPNQSSGLSAVALKTFLSDIGVGIDCSGFVSQVLNACMASFNRSERIDTNSANLRGGPGHNDRQFEVVSRPRDLSPGDTMWKTGHIRIIHRVEPQPDGSIQFVTAESSSVDLVGAVAKTWKCPQADRFAGLQVERGGAFRASTEVNVFSRYRSLAEVLRSGRPAEAEDERPSQPPPAPTASRPTPTPPPPSTTARPTPAPPPTSTPAPSSQPEAARTLTQSEIDRLTAIQFANTTDIDTFFSRKGQKGFVDWFNTTWGGKVPFQRKNGQLIRMGTSAGIKRRFTDFWNNIPFSYERPQINALDFAGLMCIVLNETGGDFSGHPEKCGAGRSDARGSHPGLAYAFDKIIGVKKSYNTLTGNRRAGDLFNDAAYIRAHSRLGGSSRLANRGGDFGGAWNSEFYPQKDFSTAEDLTENGFIMQADFYKFRGRGVIQTTSRGGYLRVVTFIQGYSGGNSVLADYKRRWVGLRKDVAATVSTTADWDSIFGETEMLNRGLALHSGSGAMDYRTMSTRADTLLQVPTPTPRDDNPFGVKGSIYFMGRRISGSYTYGKGLYRERVLAMLSSMLTL
jgi:hypothetical protein